MEATELYNISISPLVTRPFALEWSEDNHISLITQSGVHIFEFIPHPTCIYATLKFWRTFIYPSDFSPVEAYKRFINEGLWKMKRDEIHALLLEEAVTPNIDEKTSLNPRITRIAWSPKSLGDPSKCLSAIVTNAGSIEILYKFGDDWLSIWNLTEKWSRLVEEESNIDCVTVTTDSFGLVPWPKHIKRLIGTAICWSPLLRSLEHFAYIAAAFGTSEIVITRIERIKDHTEVAEPKILFKKRLTTASRINELLWVPLRSKNLHVILIGYANGKIHGLRMLEVDGKLTDEITIKYEDRADRMPITSFRQVEQEDGNFLIFATKTSCLIAYTLDANGECSSSRYLKLPAFSITGVTVLSKDKLLLTTQNSRIYTVNIKYNENLTEVSLQHDMKTSKVQYLGTAASPNKTLLLNISSPDTHYDHLTNREPSNLKIFCLKNANLDPWSLINEKVEKNISLREYWDCMESLRIAAAKSLEADKILPLIPSNLDGLKIEKLRVIMWLTTISEILEKRQLLKGVDKIIGEISDAQPLIFLISACDHLERLLLKKFLTHDEKRSVSFLRMYMEIYLAGEEEDENIANEMTRKIITIFRNSSHINTIETESCNLCGEILSELPWTIDTCPSGHKLPRCSITLLQITTVHYRSCKICGRLFHPSLDNVYDEIRCIYCDLPVIYDSRVRTCGTEESLKSWKSLLKRPAVYNQLDNTRKPDTECSGNTNGTNKRTGINKPQTFAVVVNRDDVDDSLITETWQEF